MDVWYKCNYCGKEYPIKATSYQAAKPELADICQWCNKGKYIKIPLK